MSSKKPPELHLIEGTTSRTGNTVMLPVSIRKRVPQSQNGMGSDAGIFDTDRSSEGLELLPDGLLHGKPPIF